MPAHAFKTGDKVRLVGSSSANSAEAFLDLVTSRDAKRDNVWEITRLLPADNLGFQYHVKGIEDGTERLVHEAQLTPADASPRPERTPGPHPSRHQDAR